MTTKPEFVETYRDIVSPIIVSTDSEGDGSQGGTWLIGMIVSLIAIVGWCYFLVSLLGAPIPVVVITALIFLIFAALLFPFKLMSRVKNLRKLQQAIGSSFKDINRIIGFKDSLIIWQNEIGYILECIPNHYINYNAYASDFKGFIELFSDFSIDVDFVKNTEPVEYIDLENVNIYTDMTVAFERINLYRYAKDLLGNSSKVYKIFITIKTSKSNLDALDKQLEEMKYSNYKRVFREITVLNRESVLKLISLQTGIIVTEESLITSSDNTVINKDDKRFTVYRKE